MWENQFLKASSGGHNIITHKVHKHSYTRESAMKRRIMVHHTHTHTHSHTHIKTRPKCRLPNCRLRLFSKATRQNLEQKSLVHFCTVGVVCLTIFLQSRKTKSRMESLHSRVSYLYIPPTPTSQMVSPWPSSILAFSCLWRISNSSALGLTNCSCNGEKQGGERGQNGRRIVHII